MRGRMSLQPGIDLSKTAQLFNVKIATAGQYSIKHRGYMTVRKDKNIFVLSLHIKFRVVFHYLKVQGGQQVCTP